MPKIPYKPEKTNEDDDDYEIVSFEDFCDKSPGSKTDLLTLNDNINYRLCYESDKTSKFAENEGEASGDGKQETSLDGSKNISFKKRLSGSFAPFGRGHGKTGKGLFGGVIPRRGDGESSSREQHRYQRFSVHAHWLVRLREMAPAVAGAALVLALCVAVWYAVCGALGGAWGEDHYRKLWEKAHPDNVKKPLSPIPYEKVLPEYRYHDHNNLSTKNKNASDTKTGKNRDLHKKNVRPLTRAEMDEVCPQVNESRRFDCYPNEVTNEALCHKRGCCWLPATTHGPPYCFYPPSYTLYKLVNLTERRFGLTAYYARAGHSGRHDVDTLALVVSYLSDTSLQVKIFDPTDKGFEVPIPQIPLLPDSIKKLAYRVQVADSAIGFKIIRESDNVTIVNTEDAAPIIVADKFLQISSILPGASVYGLGQQRSRLRRDINWQTMTLFNKDQPPVDNVNLYGSHPFYMSLEDSGDSHGMLLLNSNAMDVVLQPAPAITYRTIGGIINLLVVTGPTPQQVIQQYSSLVGRPFMPPYWSLGFHLCKFGYNTLNATRNVWQTNRDAGIPFDTQWNDIDYMRNRNDFTYDEERFGGLPEFVDKLHAEGMHYVLILDPGVSGSEPRGSYPPFDRGLEMNVFIKNSTNQPFYGKVWNPVSTVFPDFTHPNSTAYWVEMMAALHKKIKYDGVWIDMNEPSNFLNGQQNGECLPEDLPYKPAWIPPEGLKYKTLCMEARHSMGPHYDIHNLHALTEAIATNFALTEIRGKRPFIISRASSPGLGRHAGHWGGDIASSWADMRLSIPAMLQSSLFGIAMTGSDICGFRGNTTVELCSRWMQLGAFYPFSRNHNSIESVPQDPVSLGPTVVETSRRALRARYALLPHLYTLFWRAHVYGDTVATPLFFEDPSDPKLRDIDDQFLLGRSILVSPVLFPGVTHVNAVFPGIERWYDLLDVYKSYPCLCETDRCHVSGDQFVAFKGGSILPLQEPPPQPPVSSARSRSGPLQLAAAADRTGRARGELYWDEGDTLNSYQERKYSHIEFILEKKVLRSVVNWWGHGVPSINNITVVNLQTPVRFVTINDKRCEIPQCRFSYSSDKVLKVYTTLSLDRPFEIKWREKQSLHHTVVEDKVFRNRHPALDLGETGG